MRSAGGQRCFYGWIVVAITALAIVIAAGVRSAPGALLLPLEQELGWSRALLSAAVSLGLLLYGAVAPVSGAVIDRLGPRRVLLAGLALIGASMLASARMTALWQLYLFWGALSGIGTGMVALVLGAAVAHRWFVRRRGLVTGIFGAATSAGQLIFYPLLVQLAARGGWRLSVLLLGGLALLLLPPVVWLMRDQPADVGLRPYGADTALPAAPSAPVGQALRQALATPTFWLLALTFLICGATSNGLVGTHFIPHVGDHGVTPTVAANLLALMGAMNFLGTIVSGWLTDRYDPRRLLAIYYGLRGLSLLWLPFVSSSGGLAAFAILFGLDYIATVPPTTTLVADTFGRRQVGTIFGWIFCAHQVGAALAAWLGGVIHDWLGVYGPAFVAAGALAVLAAGLALLIDRRTRQPLSADPLATGA
ncbi:MFS transporter [Kallotenue papyrolyticum]|uniref:MFS transporter n=1 Tax=Kallotenue papyrolyticum TaxID=1325125 RepID=UPI000492AE54|nr:MFS transporter [Kallotenue papyrolyticum]